jgi:hypothetical protein
MRGSKDRSTPSVPPNAFSKSFLRRFEQQDEPPTGAEADLAGPWVLEEVPGRGFGLFRLGEGFARGFRPAAVFFDRWLALLALAVLPGTARDSLLSLRKEADEHGFGVLLDDGTVAGHFALFDEDFLEALNNAVSLLRSPAALACLLEAAGPLALERCGAILEYRIIEKPEGEE